MTEYKCTNCGYEGVEGGGYMKTKEMKRLIKDGEIVGYSVIIDRGYKGLQWGYIRAINHPDFPIYGFRVIPHDSEELGIKRNDEWLFEGDEVTHPKHGIGILNYNPYLGVMEVLFDSAPCPYHEVMEKLKRIGNIHEESNE